MALHWRKSRPSGPEPRGPEPARVLSQAGNYSKPSFVPNGKIFHRRDIRAVLGCLLMRV